MLSRLEAENLIVRCKTVLPEVAPHRGTWSDDGRGIDYLCDVYESLEPVPTVFWDGGGPEAFTNLRVLMSLAIAPGLPPYQADETEIPRYVWTILRSAHTLGAAVGYPYLEHLCRVISPWLDLNGRYLHNQRVQMPTALGGRTYGPWAGTGRHPQVSNIAHALYIVGQSATIQALRDDLAELDASMGIYIRVGDGRNLLLHGAALRSFEHRFIALLASLFYLRHVVDAVSEP